jgi:hypothetical protein
MADTHLNAWLEEARESLAAAKAAVRDAEASVDALEQKVRGHDPSPAETPQEPSLADGGEVDKKTKKVKYR